MHVNPLQQLRGFQLAVKHLLDIGCKKIAHIYGPQEIVTAQERLNGYEDYVKSFSWYTPSLMAPGHFQLEGGMQAVETLLLRHPDIDGIFAGNDFMAIGALKALHRKGVKVPEDIAVCGFDGIKLAEMIEPGFDDRRSAHLRNGGKGGAHAGTTD